MSFIDTSKLLVIERRPGWYGRYFDSANMTFGHYKFDAGATIHGHSHEQEEVWHVLEGELEITIGGETVVAGPGFVGVVLGHHLDEQSPARMLASLDGVEQILLRRLARARNDGGGLCIGPVAVTLLGLEVKLHPAALSRCIDETVRVGAKAVHVAHALRQATVREQNRDLVQALG